MPSRNSIRAPLVDWSRLEEIHEYDETGGALVRKVVATFVREGKSRVAAIATAAENRDAAGLASASHALKGAALNVGASGIAGLCAVLEGCGKEGRIDDAAASVALLEPRFMETARELEKNVPGPARRTTSGKSTAPKQKRRAARRRR
jgi:HPt (histidine-containing phosphotransfer) domain-containing protein